MAATHGAVKINQATVAMASTRAPRKRYRSARTASTNTENGSMNDFASTPSPSEAPSRQAFAGVVRRSNRRMLANAAKQAALTRRSGVVSDGGDIASVNAPKS